MRTILPVFVTGLLGVCGTLASCQTPTTSAVPKAPPSGGSAPVLESVSLRYNVPAGTGRIVSVVPDFHFIDADGDAVVIVREIVETNGPQYSLHVPPSSPIDIAAAAQRKGAVFSGGWTCGTAQYYITLRAYIMDAEGHKSNSLQYTIHCNGG